MMAAGGRLMESTRPLCSSIRHKLMRNSLALPRRSLTNVASSVTGTLGLATARYSEALVETPLLANAISTGVLCAIGDVLAQKIQHRYASKDELGARFSSDFDWGRLSRMATYGFLVGGPLYAVWYRTLDVFSHAVKVSYEPLLTGWIGATFQRASERSPRLIQFLGSLRREERAADFSPWRLVAGKVVADGLLFNPVALNAFFLTTGLLEGRSPRRIFERTKDQFYPAWALALLVWTPVQALNFSFVPLHYQAVFVSVVNVGWKSTLSILNAVHEEKATLHRRMSSENLAVGKPAASTGSQAVGAGATGQTVTADVLRLQGEAKHLHVECEALRREAADLAAEIASSEEVAAMRRRLLQQLLPLAEQRASTSDAPSSEDLDKGLEELRDLNAKLELRNGKS